MVVVSRIRNSQVVAFVVKDDERRTVLWEVEEQASSIVADVWLVALDWQLVLLSAEEGWHVSVPLNQLHSVQ